MSIYTSTNFKILGNDKPLDGNFIFDTNLNGYAGQIRYDNTAGWYVADNGTNLFKPVAGDTICFLNDTISFYSSNPSDPDDITLYLQTLDNEGEWDGYYDTHLSADRLILSYIDQLVKMRVNPISGTSSGYGQLLMNQGPSALISDRLIFSIGSNRTFSGNTKPINMIGTGLKITSSDASNYADNALILGKYNSSTGYGNTVLVVGKGNSDSQRANGLTVSTDISGITMLEVNDISTDSIETTSLNLDGMDVLNELEYRYELGTLTLPFTLNKTTVTKTNQAGQSFPNGVYGIDGYIKNIIINAETVYPQGTTIDVYTSGGSGGGNTFILENFPISDLATGNVAVEPIYKFYSGPLNVRVNYNGTMSTNSKAFVRVEYVPEAINCLT